MYTLITASCLVTPLKLFFRLFRPFLSSYLHLLGDSEFLSLSKSEFNNVLRHQYEENWQQRNTFIRNQQSFEGASIDQMKSVTDMSDMKSFPDNTVSSITHSAYFGLPVICRH